MLRLAGSAASGAAPGTPPGTATEAPAGASSAPTRPMASPTASTAARVPFHFRMARIYRPLISVSGGRAHPRAYNAPKLSRR